MVANLLISKGLFGGPDRDRTDDLFHAMEARSQLRHRPTRGKTLSIVEDGARQVKRQDSGIGPIAKVCGEQLRAAQCLSR